VTRDGFVSFFRERFSKTVVLLVAMGASRADAEDAAQEAMILAWRQWDTLQEPAAWVRTVAIRTYWKLARARRTTMLVDEFVPEAVVDADLNVFTQEQQYVLRVLRNLPPQQRTIAALSYDGLTCEEIADLLGKPSDTVRSHLRHARNALKEVMTSRTV
jgi:RNA polymerase sigma factor (sigma-70 family)